VDAKDFGFLKADSHRLRVLEKLRSGSGATSKQVSGRLRIAQRQAEATIKELMERGLVSEEKGIFSLTDEGIRALAQVSRAGM